MTFLLLFLIKFGVKPVKINKRLKMQENLAAAKYEISRVAKADLAAITHIYNASVLERNTTATLHPVDIED